MTAKPGTWPTSPGSDASAPPAAEHMLSGRLSVGEGRAITVRVGKVELGQGISTALAQIAADCLGVGYDRIEMAEVVTGASPNEGFTSGSRSVMDAGGMLARACRQARELFVAEAARHAGCSVSEIAVADGEFRDNAGRVVGDYWSLARPGLLDVPLDSTPAAPVRGESVGKSVPRADLPAKVSGRPSYVHDMALPGQLYGRVVRPPAPGARLVDVDLGSVSPRPLALVRDGSFLGVVAEREYAAIRCVDSLRRACTWTGGAIPELPLDRLDGEPAETIPVVEKAAEQAEPAATVHLRYSRPFLAHASIGPAAAVAVWEGDRVTVWSHSQGIYPLRASIARVCEVPEQAIEIRHAQGAGCYGHNGADDVALDATLLARAVPGRPVQVVWSREDEFSWEPYGPAMLAAIEAGTDSEGNVVTWRHHVWGYGHVSRPGYAGNHGLLAGWHAADMAGPAAIDPPLAGGGGTARNAAPIYDFPAQEVVAHRLLDSPVRTSSLRALGAMLNVFAIESAMDELARSASADPVDYRLRHLADVRARAVLEAAATAAGWGRGAVRDNEGRGVAMARYKNNCAYCAAVADVTATDRLVVRRLTLAVDAGLVLNPDGLANQVEGGAVQATSMTVLEQVSFANGSVASRDWDSYPVLRFPEVPEVAVKLLDRSDEPPLGVGECAAGPVAAAIANALADAIGVRVRDLPLTPQRIVAAMEG